MVTTISEEIIPLTDLEMNSKELSFLGGKVMAVIFGYDLNELMVKVLKFAASSPWEFIYYVLLILSPLFLISAILAWRLAKDIQHKEKDKKRKAKREANMAKARRHKTD